MYFTEVLRVLLRRWYVVLVGIVALGAAGMMVMRYVPTQYQAAGQVLFVLPVDATGKDTPTNPFLNLQSGLGTTASIVANTVGSKDTQRKLNEEGHDAEYSAEVLPGAGPIIVVTAKDASPANALATRDAVMELIANRVKTLQENLDIPDTQLIRALRTNVDERAEVLPGAKIKALVAIGAGIAVLTLVIAFVLDGWLRNRPRRRRRGKGAEEQDDSTPLEDDPRPREVPSRVRETTRPAARETHGKTARPAAAAPARTAASPAPVRASASAPSGAPAERRTPAPVSRPADGPTSGSASGPAAAPVRRPAPAPAPASGGGVHAARETPVIEVVGGTPRRHLEQADPAPAAAYEQDDEPDQAVAEEEVVAYEEVATYDDAEYAEDDRADELASYEEAEYADEPEPVALDEQDDTDADDSDSDDGSDHTDSTDSTEDERDEEDQDEVAARRRAYAARMRGGSLAPVAMPGRGLL